jgi:hypothetical protein
MCEQGTSEREERWRDGENNTRLSVTLSIGLEK